MVQREDGGISLRREALSALHGAERAFRRERVRLSPPRRAPKNKSGQVKEDWSCRQTWDAERAGGKNRETAWSATYEGWRQGFLRCDEAAWRGGCWVLGWDVSWRCLEVAYLVGFWVISAPRPGAKRAN
jgi:hypothetical protein